MNVFIFTGRLGQDAEVKYTQNQTAVCSFSVAVDSGFGDNKKTTWVRCALFGKRAEGGLPQYLKKGAQVAVSGEATLREYEHNGKHGASLEVRVNEIDLIGGKQDSQNNQQGWEGYNQPASRQQPPANQPQGVHQRQPQGDINNGGAFDDDLPF